MIRLLLALALAAELLFLPLIAALRESTLRLRAGESAVVECAADTLYVATQSRARLAVECIDDATQPIVPTPEK